MTSYVKGEDMRLIVNTNRIIAATIRDSFSRRIIQSKKFELITIVLARQEVENHRTEIREESNLGDQEIDLVLSGLFEKIFILEDWMIQKFMPKARGIMEKIDPSDTPFIAAALAAKADIWSHDAHFAQQKKIKVWKTAELAKFL